MIDIPYSDSKGVNIRIATVSAYFCPDWTRAIPCTLRVVAAGIP